MKRIKSVWCLTCKYVFVSDWSRPSNPGRRPKSKSTSLPLSPACANSWWILTATSWAMLEDTRTSSSGNERTECESSSIFPCTCQYSQSITLSFIYCICLRMWKAKLGFCSSTYCTRTLCFQAQYTVCNMTFQGIFLISGQWNMHIPGCVWSHTALWEISCCKNTRMKRMHRRDGNLMRFLEEGVNFLYAIYVFASYIFIFSCDFFNKNHLCYNLEWSVLACFILKDSHHEESNMNDWYLKWKWSFLKTKL